MAVLAKCHRLLVELKHPLPGPSSSAAKEELLVKLKHSVPVKQPDLCYPMGGQQQGYLEHGINAIEVSSPLRIGLAALQQQRQVLANSALVDIKLPWLQPLQHPIQHFRPAHQLLSYLCNIGNPGCTSGFDRILKKLTTPLKARQGKLLDASLTLHDVLSQQIASLS